MTTHIALCAIPGYGHVQPILDVVGELTARGNRVTVASTDQFGAPLEAAGAEVIRYGATREGATDANSIADALAGFSSCADPIAPIRAKLLDDKPDVLGFDSTMWLAGRLLSAPLARPTLQLSPCFVSNEHFSLPERVGEYAAREAALESTVDSGGPAEEPIDIVAEVKALLKAEGITTGLEEFVSDARDRKLVFIPREFQYAGDTFDDRHAFVGPCLGPRRLAGQWSPPDNGHPVLLVSLGTSTFNDQPGFFRSCARAFAGLPWNLVLTLGGGTDPATLGPLPPNVQAHQWLPHPAVLDHARAFVTSAGMGSIMESLSRDTPVVGVPHHGEQEVNTDRILELGLGGKIARQDVTAESVRDTVLAVAEDTAIADRVHTMSEHFARAGGHRQAADEILNMA
ncbi:macrolide family glycosyltransferase [Amycolatopsis minnesotensis]|uniref:Glycosyltransferase n=1 Tax=Amycolatopsis minnesotensis TaxID=337894 RepID=A0ABN2QIW1_9PSEU